MTEKDKEDIARMVAEQINMNSSAEQHAACPLGLDHETAAFLQETFKGFREGKKTIRKTVITILTTSFIGLIVYAVVEKIKAIKP